MIDVPRLELIIKALIPYGERCRYDFHRIAEHATIEDGRIRVHVIDFYLFLHPETYEILEKVGGETY